MTRTFSLLLRMVLVTFAILASGGLRQAQAYRPSVCFSADGRQVFCWPSWSAGDDGITSYDLATGETVRTYVARRKVGQRHSHVKMTSPIVLTPDGRTLVAGCEDGTVSLWDVGTGKERRVLKVHRESISSLALSPDGKRVLFGTGSWTQDGTGLAQIRELETGKVLLTLFDGQRGPFTGAAFSPDGRTVVTVGGEKGRVRLWGAESGREWARLQGEWETAVFAPSGRFLLTSADKGGLCLWEVASGRAVWRIHMRRGDDRYANPVGMMSVAFCRNGQAILAGVRGGIRLWDLSGRTLRTFGKDYGEARAVALSRDGKRLVSYAGFGHSSLANPGGRFFLSVWDMDSGEEVRTLEGTTTEGPDLIHATFSGDGKRILAVYGYMQRGFRNEKSWFILWETATGKRLTSFHRKGAQISQVALSPDGSRALSVSDDPSSDLEGPKGEILLWELPLGRVLKVWEKGPGAGAVAFSADGRRALTAGSGHPLRVWKVATGRPVLSLGEEAVKSCYVRFAADGKRAFLGSDYVVDLATRKTRKVFRGEKAKVVVFSPDGVRVEPSTEHKGPEKAKALVITPDGRWGAGGNHILALYDLQRGQRVRWLTLVDVKARLAARKAALGWHDSPDYGRVAISADGRFVLSSGQVGGSGLLLWDARAGKPLRRFIGKGVDGKGGVLEFSPDGKYAISGGEGPVLKLWAVVTGREARSLVGPTSAALGQEHEDSYLPLRRR